MSYLTQVALVGCGGFVGSSLRFMVNGWVQAATPASSFPYGTLVVNVVGCLTIGVLGGLADARQALDPALRLLVFTGVIGGFTTFSAFAYETLSLARHVDLASALANVALQVVLGIGAAWLGYAATHGV